MKNILTGIIFAICFFCGLPSFSVDSRIPSKDIQNYVCVTMGTGSSGSCYTPAVEATVAAGAIAAGATSIADNEDVLSADADRGIKVLATRKATPADVSGSDGDYEFFQIKSGRVWANSIATGTNAHDAAALETNPVQAGLEAVNSDGTAPPNRVSAEGDTVRAIGTRDGIQYVDTGHPFAWCATEAETAATTNDSIVAAPGAGLSLYVKSLIISNGATAGDYKLVEDTAGTPVTKVEKIYTAITGGAVLNFDPPIRITANKDIGITSTTVTTGSYTVCGYTAP